MFTTDGVVSAPEVVAALLEYGWASRQEEGWRAKTATCRQLRERAAWLGTSVPFSVSANAVHRAGTTWTSNPGYSFCLALSLAELFPSWSSSFGKDYTEQGELFEQLTVFSLRELFPKWNVHETGWRRCHAEKLNHVVEEVFTRLRERPGSLFPWTRGTENDAGLDILCYRDFGDTRASSLALLIQCASGRLRDAKLKEPDIRVWQKIVDFSSSPVRGFAAPYALNDSHFRYVCARVDGLTLDRCRIMSAASANRDWLPREFSKSLVGWLRPRVNKLLAEDN
jgi:hypothetical protein